MNWKNNIESALERDLPGIESHKKMLPPGRDLYYPAGEKGNIRKSGVMLLLFEESDDLYGCLIKRPMHMKHHPGQIGLPGGTVELTDNSLIDTALRETQEELGIEPRIVDVLGTLSELYIPVSKFNIYPIIGWTDQKPQFTLNNSEVDQLIFFPVLSHIRNGMTDEAEVETLNGPLKVPCFKFQGEIIWGATAMILSEFLDILRNLLSESE
jgi:8-oxo-dGTP pyrophosphatase MutT (NUDIX family)